MKELNAVTLKEELWDTLKKIKSNELEAARGDAIASQAREILRTIKTQVQIIDKMHENITTELQNFAAPKNK